MMIIFATPTYYRRFIRPVRDIYPDIVVGEFDTLRFSNQEMHVIVNSDVSGQDCLIIGSIAPPDKQLMAILMLADSLKRSGADSINAFLPYLSYARQDKFKSGESGGIALIGSLLKSSGLDKIITVDAHSEQDQQLIGLPLASLDAAPLFLPSIQNLSWNNFTILAPDEGAIGRSQAVARALENAHPVAYLKKQHVDGIVHLDLVGKVSSRVLIIDDIIDSGYTLVSACNTLKEQGVQEIAVAVTHGLFTGEAWKRLFGLGVKSLFVSNSCSEAVQQRHMNVHVISLTPLLSTVLLETVRKEKQYENANI